MASIPSSPSPSDIPELPSSYPASTNLPAELNRKLKQLAASLTDETPTELKRINEEISSRFKFNLLEGTVEDRKDAVAAKFTPVKKGDSLESMQETAKKCIAFIEKEHEVQRAASRAKSSTSFLSDRETLQPSVSRKASSAPKAVFSLKQFFQALASLFHNIKVFLNYFLKFSISLEITEKLHFLAKMPHIDSKLFEKMGVEEPSFNEDHSKVFLEKLKKIQNNNLLSPDQKKAAKKELNKEVDARILVCFQESAKQVVSLFKAAYKKAATESLLKTSPQQRSDHLSSLAESLDKVRAKLEKKAQEEAAPGKTMQSIQVLRALMQEGTTLITRIEKALKS